MSTLNETPQYTSIILSHYEQSYISMVPRLKQQCVFPYLHTFIDKLIIYRIYGLIRMCVKTWYFGFATIHDYFFTILQATQLLPAEGGTPYIVILDLHCSRLVSDNYLKKLNTAGNWVNCYVLVLSTGTLTDLKFNMACVFTMTCYSLSTVFTEVLNIQEKNDNR